MSLLNLRQTRQITSALCVCVLLDVVGVIQYVHFEFAAETYAAYSSWRPYSNPNRLITLGMNKGEVLAIAGKPDHEESYYQSSGRRLLRISDWYYVRTGHTPESTILKFTEETLVSITSTPTR